MRVPDRLPAPTTTKGRTHMHTLIAGPQQHTYLVARPGARRGVQLRAARYDELAAADAADALVPEWLVDAARKTWALDLAGRPVHGTVVVRARTRLNYSRATWELNKGCNFNCAMCYLAQRTFEGLPWSEKARLIDMFCEAGVPGFSSLAGSRRSTATSLRPTRTRTSAGCCWRS